MRVTGISSTNYKLNYLLLIQFLHFSYQNFTSKDLILWLIYKIMLKGSKKAKVREIKKRIKISELNIDSGEKINDKEPEFETSPNLESRTSRANPSLPQNATPVQSQGNRQEVPVAEA